MNAGLDYETTFCDGEGEWQVWTPDTTGAVLGSGKTEVEALCDAMRNMESLHAVLLKKIHKNGGRKAR